MRSIAVFSVKGGVGKTALAVNLAHAAASLSKRRTLLWDLDAQGAATWMLRLSPSPKASARKGIAAGALLPLVQATDFAGLDVLAADKSLRNLEKQLADDDRAKRLKKLLKGLDQEYDRIILDCPPGLTELADQVFRAVDLLVVPMLPSPLSGRAFEQMVDHLGHMKDPPPVLPVFTMVDRRKSLHRNTLLAFPDRPAIPYAAAIEDMGTTRLPVLAKSSTTVAARALANLWTQVERALVRPA
ncbi:ParA family protein [Polymorphobacter fuscus]|uniref:AAA family ATPase n=1 Tax=Sandarakinorhabdus fusca TaxID=1439888 RepID=A0A7C9KWG4_9SPHN|nr:ParA family protein [Polymorphobacter fuscus]KAB7648428.1 ParA family protein [Polymorphobacter fuscus]MQT15946.1 AAA family ATPase [Polymorphobacter fuscus]NJC07778.1 cellulose biosynthesis protein BcsQ [Polymorphobacter fuscus]